MHSRIAQPQLTGRRLAGYALGAVLTAPMLTMAVSLIASFAGLSGDAPRALLDLVAFAFIAVILFLVRSGLRDSQNVREMMLFHSVVNDDSLSIGQKLWAVLTGWYGIGLLYVAAIAGWFGFGLYLVLVS